MTFHCCPAMFHDFACLLIIFMFLSFFRFIVRILTFVQDLSSLSSYSVIVHNFPPSSEKNHIVQSLLFFDHAYVLFIMSHITLPNQSGGRQHMWKSSSRYCNRGGCSPQPPRRNFQSTFTQACVIIVPSSPSFFISFLFIHHVHCFHIDIFRNVHLFPQCFLTLPCLFMIFHVFL